MHLLFTNLIWLWAIAALHPMHLSVTHVDFNPKTGSLEITHKIFIDDFESALRLYHTDNFKLGTEKETSDADEFIKAYMAKQFWVKVNGKSIDGEYLGREMDLEAIWIYQEVKNVGAASAIEVKNEILLDLYDDQKNILHIKYQDQKQSFLYSIDQTIEKMAIE